MSRRRLGYLLKHANLRLSELVGAALAPYGIDGREFAVLALLDSPVPMSQLDAARRLGIDRTTMVAMVDALERKDLVRRRPHPDDRRKNVVEPTERGHRTLGGARIAVDAAEEEFLSALSGGDAGLLRDVLERLVPPPAG
ncbi:MarR family winged helix-turn-helix transcriptional regulator [Nonomuraea fuscirosea]|uniref:MarR family winged helix-turn-helix transcriptional regulator n=1 Tax=Nonomuraea fuscirosea TaxID=1291556 RepID=UPI002DDB6893|nr:MarR family transcriptional regulator [Nonomuraea fuscirosea]WSA54620.1 MarR family transcriptional regulator [Nonomuraea fuscirosea]